ncbi:MAG TPA: adenine phosphoribosyltransferase [Ignavibacteriales bacterium]|nr:adenine phosphoribosyltransferase [Ignavibacteriales bacterium]HOL81522.1 adenine phosphoribosyltransferase [Ignavibacteriales bacterium]HPD67049.1 adenine phosphoribosyltransferase [Ignavibacteriales bacterium]HPP33551.1 adenine phosphoribosyltransferase [Ignavibacteriales bacterium]HRR19485.1 adenine phosphoribosyltransferase [Ignavibacteriales bacterium]
MDLKQFIRNIPDFPKQGILFRDITTLLKDPKSFNYALDELYNSIINKNITKVVAIESRGFIFGSLLANKLNAGFVPIRKPNKLPAEKIAEEYALEYGTDKIEIHKDAITSSDNILLHDDLLATGGTMLAACKLVEKLGGKISQISFLIELEALNGRNLLKDYNVTSIIKY